MWTNGMAAWLQRQRFWVRLLVTDSEVSSLFSRLLHYHLTEMTSFLFDGLTAIIPYPAVFPIRCEACNHLIKESTFKRDVFRHSRKCLQKNPGAPVADELVFECTHCNHRATDRRKATTHQATHFGEESFSLPSFPCFCNRNFATQKALSSHQVRCPAAKQQCVSAPPREHMSTARTPRTSLQSTEQGNPPPPNAIPDIMLPTLPVDFLPLFPSTRDDPREYRTELYYSFLSVNSLPDGEYDAYPAPPSNSSVRIDEAFAALIPTKQKPPKRETPKPTYRISAAALQKMYTVNYG